MKWLKMKKSLPIIILECLYYDKDVATLNGSNDYSTTRVANPISRLRNQYDIEIVTLRVNTSNSWYGRYKLTRAKENLDKVKKIINTHSKQKPTKKVDV